MRLVPAERAVGGGPTTDNPRRACIGDEVGEMGDGLVWLDIDTGFQIRSMSGGARRCAVSRDGRVKCWGLGSGTQSATPEIVWGTGRLGLEDPSKVELPHGRESPMPYVDLGAEVVVKRLAASADATCALADDGRVKCWGANGDGDLGYEDTQSRGGEAGDIGDGLPYVDLRSGRVVHALVASGNEFCALLDDRSVKCWGTLEHGGSPGTMGDNLDPVLRADQH